MLWNQSAPCGETCSKKSWAKCSQIDGAVSPSRKHPLGQEPQQLRARIEEWESTGHSKTLIRTLERQRTFIEGLIPSGAADSITPAAAGRQKSTRCALHADTGDRLFENWVST